MRENIHLSVVIVMLLCGPGFAAVASTEITGTMVMSADQASIAGAGVKICLYEYNQEVRFSPPKLLDQAQIVNFAHTKGTETKTPFSIGLKPRRKVNMKMRHFVTLFIHTGDPSSTPRTHMGYARTSKETCKVLTGGNPTKIVMKVLLMRGVVLPKIDPSKKSPATRPASQAPKPAAAVVDDFRAIQQAQFVFTAKLTRATPRPTIVGRSSLRMHTLGLAVKDVLRGDTKPNTKITINHLTNQELKPIYPVGELCLVAAGKSRTTIKMKFLGVVDDDLMKTARLATSLPFGWSKREDKLVSPWASLGGGAWPASPRSVAGARVCSVTGRPAFMVGKGVSMKVEKVPPKKEFRGLNRDGDGPYTVTITNETDKSILIPALLHDGKAALWTESLVILCQGEAHPAPGARGLATAPKIVRLKPKRSISTVVDVLRLKDVKWPDGGNRVEFLFCLGELGVDKSFYYMSQYHDKLRKAAAGKR
jgi:hypothetical protein